MWIKKIKKKKFQFVLISLMLCFTSLILAACVSFVVEISAYTKEFVSYRNCPRLIALCKEAYDQEYFTEHSELMAQTDRITNCDVTVFDNNFWFGEKQLKTYINLAYHVDTTDTFMHQLKLLQGEGNGPADGEIWINSVTADSYGIKVGDIIHMGSSDGKAFRIGGVVA